jgi:multicomponent Na+:H+ antiporter subunit G
MSAVALPLLEAVSAAGPIAADPAVAGLSVLRQFLAAALVGAGVLFVIAGTVGVQRFPDVYTRAHATPLVEQAGALLLLGGLAVAAPDPMTAIKLLAIAAALAATSPAAVHATLQAAFAAGETPLTGRWRTSPPSRPPEERR